MIYLTPGTTQSVWISLRESIPYGVTGSFLFTMTNDMSGEIKSFYPTDLQPDNKWSRFNLLVNKPEDLENSVIDARPGMWEYKVELAGFLLDTGKILVEESKIWTTLDRPQKNIKVLKR